MYRTVYLAAIAVAATLAATSLSFANSDICARMQERLDQLNSNINLDDYELTLRRDRVEAALDANDCPVLDEPIHESPRRDVPLYEEPQRDRPLYEEPRREAAQPRPYEVLGKQPEAVEPGMSTAPVYGGRYQTLCVRTCDGYYFPISYETGAENFSRDQAQCQAQCPGAKLFYQPTYNQNPEKMISLRGDIYKNMPNAFKFKKVGANATPQCTCQRAAGNFTTLGNPKGLAKEPAKPAPAAEPSKPAETKAEPVKPTQPADVKAEPAKPVEAKAEPAKPAETKPAASTPASDPAANPSSIIQLGAPATPKIEAEKPKPLTEDKPIDPNRKVRVVGPTFLPDQAGATSPQAQDRKSAQ